VFLNREGSKYAKGCCFVMKFSSEAFPLIQRDFSPYPLFNFFQQRLDLGYRVFLIAWHCEGISSVTHVEMAATRFGSGKTDPFQFFDKIPSFARLPFRHEPQQSRPERQASCCSS